MKRLFFLSLIFSFSLFAAQEPSPGKAATTRVLLKKDIDGALVEVKGAYQVYDPKTGKTLSGGRNGKRFYLYGHQEGIKWGENFLGYFQLRITPTKSGTTLFVDGVQYKGSLEIYHTGDKLTVINEVDVENYLKSTLTPQFERLYGSSVMEALSIVGRTNIYAQVLQNKGALWHVDAKEVGYTGYGSTLINPEIEKAIDSTKYLVMTLDQRPFYCSWTGNCAGKTARYDAIFRKQVAAPAGIESPFAKQARSDHHWSLSVERGQIARIAKVNRITSIEPFVEPESNKIYAIRIFDGAHHKDLDFSVLQSGLGKDNLLSNDFTLSLQGNMVIFDGYGQGSGVGLCIYSASQMAKRGDTIPDILATFFPYTHLEKMETYPDPYFSRTDSRTPTSKRKTK